jgi:hypothetical protein
MGAKEEFRQGGGFASPAPALGQENRLGILQRPCSFGCSLQVLKNRQPVPMADLIIFEMARPPWMEEVMPIVSSRVLRGLWFVLLLLMVPPLRADIPRVRSDFNGDGRSELLWRNASTGAVYLMPMDGAAVQPGSVIYTEPNPAWQIMGTGDFDGDGRADILWWNATTGQVYLMLMEGSSIKRQQMIYIEPDLAWRIAGIGDFDGDGKADILWRNTSTGAVYRMPMNGTTVLAGSVIYSEPNPAWQINAVADFNGDGTADILWQNNVTGQVYLMPMVGGSAQPGTIIYVEPNPLWQIKGTGDFDGDGKADILWRNSATGAIYLMFMNGPTIQSGTIVYTEPNPAWQIVSLGDFNGDGKSDILWWNRETGQVYQMLMNKASIGTSSMVYTEPNIACMPLAEGTRFNAVKKLVWAMTKITAQTNPSDGLVAGQYWNTTYANSATTSSIHLKADVLDWYYVPTTTYTISFAFNYSPLPTRLMADQPLTVAGTVARDIHSTFDGLAGYEMTYTVEGGYGPVPVFAKWVGGPLQASEPISFLFTPPSPAAKKQTLTVCHHGFQDCSDKFYWRWSGAVFIDYEAIEE